MRKHGNFLINNYQAKTHRERLMQVKFNGLDIEAM